MKKRFLSVFLALALCLGLLPATAQAAYAVMDVGEIRTLTCTVSSSSYRWSVDNDSILDLDDNGRSCVIKGKRAGSAIVWVEYEYRAPRPAVSGNGGTEYDTVSQFEKWGIIVKDPSDPNPPTPASLPTPSRVAGKVGQDMNGLITGIKDFNYGLVPVQYDGLWGLANAELKLVVPCQFDDIGSITDTGYLVVKMDGKYYIIDTKCEVVFAYSPTSKKESVSCHSGYFTVVHVYSSSSSGVGDARVAEHYNYLGEQISVTEANALDAARNRRRDTEGVLAILEKRGKAEDGSILWLFCKASQQYQKNPEVVLRMPANGRTNEWLELQEGLFGVYDWHHYGAVNREGKLVIPCEYDYLGPSQDGYMSYQKGNQFGLLKNPVNPPSGEVVKPDTSKPDTSKPDTSKPDTSKPDTSKPDTSKPDTTKPGQTVSNPDFTIENGVLINYRGAGGAVVIPSGVTSIGEGAFAYCTKLTGVTFPSGITSIGNRAFSGCTGLTSVTIPSGVTSIGENAFFNCAGLTSVTFPSGLTSIGDWAFYSCTGLTSVTIPDSVTSIGRYAFYKCSGLTSVTISSNMASIASSAFSGCTGLTSITIPASVTSIGLFAFDDCTALKNVYYAGTKAQWKAVKISLFNDSLKSAAIHYEQNTAPASDIAYAKTQTILLDGKSVELEAYALVDSTGGATNYVKLRDLAYLINGTKAQFSVDWSREKGIQLVSGKRYVPNGSELFTPFSGNRPYTTAKSPTMVNSIYRNIDAFILEDDNKGAYTYYKLRDLGKELGFNVSYINRQVVVNTNEPYSDAQ